MCFAYSLAYLDISEYVHVRRGIDLWFTDSIGCLSVPRFRYHDISPTAFGIGYEDSFAEALSFL